MNQNDFLKYSACEPMTVLRKRFNQGENLYKPVPDAITADEALEDILYLQYVLENAYSGYPYFRKALFDNAFSSMRRILNQQTTIKPNHLIDMISEQLSFINDGHLSFTTEAYGRGFYQQTLTYVSNMLLEEKDGKYFDTSTQKHIELYGNATLFHTVSTDDRCLYLVGESSKQEIQDVQLLIDGCLTKVPVHKIRSIEATEEVLVSEAYYDDIAIITCNTFLGDSEQDLKKLKSIGEKCRKYPHVIWNLSNNLGGNSAFAEQFLTGLNGGYRNTALLRSLNSTLVHAKEYGEIKETAYHFTEEKPAAFAGEDLFCGTLHVIFNNCVASSGELALIYARSLPKVVFYGCNTMGIGHFGDLCIYYLPHSKITLWCPQKVFQTIIPETEGMHPDFWIDSSDVLSVVKDHIRSHFTDSTF